jgi:magnesium chelatase family protein
MLALLTDDGYIQPLLVRPRGMVAKVRTVAFHGVEVIEVEAQVTIASGLPAFTVVGLPDKAVAESRERVRAALASLGLALPPKRITVNLAPADVVKEGSHFDLPVALGLLAAMEALPADEIGGYTVLGELALDGSLTSVAGVLLAALAAATRGNGVICPAACGGEAAWAGEVEIVAAPSLLAIINHFKGTQLLPPPEPRLVASRSAGLDLADVKGQESSKRVLEIAAAGGHNLLMVGPPGSGKSMLAARLPGILPPLEPSEALELGMIQSVAGGMRHGGLSRERPFRDPHHSASLAALVGGGPRARPGEISLAHQGVLFLDELAEFNRAALEALRQPLETGRVTVARAQGHVTYPARFQLVAAMNPCRCGYFAEAACGRAPRCAEDYQSRLSGPLVDRIDLYIDVPAVSPADLALPPAAEGSAAVARRVAAARARQSARYAAMPAGHGIRINGEADGVLLDTVATPDPAGRALLTLAAEKLRLSARAYHRVMRIARTLADLEGADGVGRRHVAEALSYRRVRASSANLS